MTSRRSPTRTSLLGYLPDGATAGRRAGAAARPRRAGPAAGWATGWAWIAGRRRSAWSGSRTPRWCRALRLISVQRGLDPRDFALVAFGGAGGLHACALAEELGCRTVLVPRAAGVLSALGLAISEVRHDFVRSACRRRRSPDTTRRRRPADLRHRARRAAAAGPPGSDRPRSSGWRTCGMPGQSFELTSPGSTAGALARDLPCRARAPVRPPDRRRAGRDRQRPAGGDRAPARRPDLHRAESRRRRRRAATGDGVPRRRPGRALTSWTAPAMGRGSRVKGACGGGVREATCLVGRAGPASSTPSARWCSPANRTVGDHG